MSIKRTLGIAFSMSSTTMFSLMPSLMIASPVCSPLTSQMDSLVDLLLIGASMLINNHQNYIPNSPQNFPLSKLLN